VHFRIPDAAVGTLVTPLEHHRAVAQRTLHVLLGEFDRADAAFLGRRGHIRHCHAEHRVAAGDAINVYRSLVAVDKTAAVGLHHRSGMRESAVSRW
jgi:hypothetical protein